jgi:hypothetical protein
MAGALPHYMEGRVFAAGAGWSKAYDLGEMMVMVMVVAQDKAWGARV